MEYVWSPWRMDYIQRPPEKNEGCVFCDALAFKDGPENLVVWRGVGAYVILNRYPYTSGHVMVVPNDHQPDLESLDSTVRSINRRGLIRGSILVMPVGQGYWGIFICMSCRAGSGIRILCLRWV